MPVPGFSAASQKEDCPRPGSACHLPSVPVPLILPEPTLVRWQRWSDGGDGVGVVVRAVRVARLSVLDAGSRDAVTGAVVVRVSAAEMATWQVLMASLRVTWLVLAVSAARRRLWRQLRWWWPQPFGGIVDASSGGPGRTRGTAAEAGGRQGEGTSGRGSRGLLVCGGLGGVPGGDKAGPVWKLLEPGKCPWH